MWVLKKKRKSKKKNQQQQQREDNAYKSLTKIYSSKRAKEKSGDKGMPTRQSLSLVVVAVIVVAVRCTHRDHKNTVEKKRTEQIQVKSSAHPCC